MAILVDVKSWGPNLKQAVQPTNPYFGLIWYDTINHIYIEYYDSKWNQIISLPPLPHQGYGYDMGGNTSGNYVSKIDRITFPFDSGVSTDVGNLTQTKARSAGCNASDYGYVMAGYGGNNVSFTERITFPFDSGTASNVGNLSGTERGSGCGIDETDFIDLFC